MERLHWKKEIIWVGLEWWHNPMQIRFKESPERRMRLYKSNLSHLKETWCYATQIWENRSEKSTVQHKLNMKSNSGDTRCYTNQICKKKVVTEKMARRCTNYIWKSSHWNDDTMLHKLNMKKVVTKMMARCYKN